MGCAMRRGPDERWSRMSDSPGSGSCVRGTDACGGARGGKASAEEGPARLCEDACAVGAGRVEGPACEGLRTTGKRAAVCVVGRPVVIDVGAEAGASSMGDAEAARAGEESSSAIGSTSSDGCDSDAGPVGGNDGIPSVCLPPCALGALRLRWNVLARLKYSVWDRREKWEHEVPTGTGAVCELRYGNVFVMGCDA